VQQQRSRDPIFGYPEHPAPLSGLSMGKECEALGERKASLD
jgi:hypothetical protein